MTKCKTFDYEVELEEPAVVEKPKPQLVINSEPRYQCVWVSAAPTMPQEEALRQVLALGYTEVSSCHAAEKVMLIVDIETKQWIWWECGVRPFFYSSGVYPKDGNLYFWDKSKR